MAELEVKLVGTVTSEEEEIEALGVVSVINFNGRIKGRVLLDMAPKLALYIAQKLMAEEYEDEIRDLK